MPTNWSTMEEVDAFMMSLRSAQVCGSADRAMHTLVLLRKIVAHTRWSTAADLMASVHVMLRKWLQSRPRDTVVGNMIYRVLKIIREEYCSCVGKIEGESDSLHLILRGRQEALDFSKSSPSLKAVIIEAINELVAELSNSVHAIASLALEHIHTNEVIMTAGYSKTVEAFLLRAAQKRKFSVIVAECYPFNQGQTLSVNLARENINVTLIPDSAVFAMMGRVNKVIIGTHTVMADGGLKAISGMYGVAMAARHHAVPLIVCAGLFKLTPQYVSTEDPGEVSQLMSPEMVLDYGSLGSLGNVQVLNPAFEYIPAELVTLFITNVGGNAPSYMYRLLSELYHPEDSIIKE